MHIFHYLFEYIFNIFSIYIFNYINIYIYMIDTAIYFLLTILVPLHQTYKSMKDY